MSQVQRGILWLKRKRERERMCMYTALLGKRTPHNTNTVQEEPKRARKSERERERERRNIIHV